MGGAMKSLSELKSSPDVGLPERTVRVCVSAKLLRELEAADEAMFEAQSAYERERQAARDRANGEPVGPPKRAGTKSPLPDLERAAEEATAKADRVRARMEDASVELLLRGKSQGEWREWARRHPARDEDEDRQGFERDHTWAAGSCNIDALISDLHLWVAKYNGEDPSDAWAEFVAANGVPASLRIAASTVVGMHEQVVDAGKPRGAWRADRMSALDSE